MNKPLRDAKGRFVKKNAPVVKKEPPPKPSLETRLREAMRNKMGDGRLNVSTNGIRYADGTDRLNPQDICAARFYADNRYAKAVEAIVIIDDYYKNYDDNKKASYKEFLNYLFNVSPWKDAFLTKCPDIAVTTCVSFDVEQDASFILNAQQVMRQWSEFPAFRDTYVRLRNEGFSVEHSVIASLYFKIDQRNEKKFVFTGDAGHTAVYSNGKLEQVRRFFNHNGYNKDRKKFSEYRPYVPYICFVVADNSYFGEGFKQTLRKKLNKPDENGWGVHVNDYSLWEIGFAIGLIFGEIK